MLRTFAISGLVLGLCNSMCYTLTEHVGVTENGAQGGIGGVFASSLCVSILYAPTAACKNWQARVVDAWLLGVFFTQWLPSRGTTHLAEWQSPIGNDC